MGPGNGGKRGIDFEHEICIVFYIRMSEISGGKNG